VLLIITVIRANPDECLRSLTFNSELFHHIDGRTVMQSKENSVTPVDGCKQVMGRNETSNIEFGFLIKDFNFRDDVK
jgi:hypothetical protein